MILVKRDKAKMARLVEEIGKCEFCGSKRGIEAHHIVPISCGGDNSDENLVVCCTKCHAILTPRSLLAKIGIENASYENKEKQFLGAVLKRISDEEPGSAVECVDIFLEMYSDLAKGEL